MTTQFLTSLYKALAIPFRQQGPEINEPLREQDVSIETLAALFRRAYIRTECDEDDELVIRGEPGITVRLRLDPASKYLVFITKWGLKESEAEIDKLKYVNSLNDRLLMVRFSLPIPTVLYCDYFFYYDGGITPEQIIMNYRRFIGVCRSAVSRDAADLLE